jgi:peptide deformylase
MILPIVTYGDSVLKTRAEPIGPDYPELQKLIEDMFETMANAQGVGLAAPQIGRSIRLFVVDGSGLEEEFASLQDFRMVFINPEIVEDQGDDVEHEEGCLSIPGLRGKVERPDAVVIRYQDLQFEQHEATFEGMQARIIQHEYDHVEGVLFTDRLSFLQRNRLQKKLNAMARGDVKASYPLQVPTPRKARKRS